MESRRKQYNQPLKSRLSRRNEMDVECKRLARLYPFLTTDQIKCKAKDYLNSRNRDVYEFDADSEGETSFPKKDAASTSKAKTSRARYKPLSVMSTKSNLRTKKTKVIAVIDLSSDSDNDCGKKEDFVWRSIKIKKESDIAVKSVKKTDDKVGEETKKGMRREKSTKESEFDKLLLTETKYVKNPERKASEHSNDQEGWRPFMSKTRTYVGTPAVPINDNQSVTVTEAKTVENDEESRSAKSEPNRDSSDIQERGKEFKDKSNYLQPGVDVNIWEITESLNSEQLKIKTDFDGYGSNDSVPEVKNNFWKKSNASKFEIPKFNSEDIKIKNVSGNKNSKVNKYLNPHFYMKKLDHQNHSPENQWSTRSAGQSFHRKILAKDTVAVLTPNATKGSEEPKSEKVNWSPIEILMNNNRPDEMKARKNTALAEKLQSLKEIPEDSNSLNQILQAVYKVRETEEQRRSMDQKTLRAKRVLFADGGFLCSLFD